MPEHDQTDRPRLVRRIKERRRSIDSFLRRERPRAARLTYVSVVSSALAAALTAGPGLGGTKFTGAVADLVQADNPADVWRPLCLFATVVSVVAAISANLSKSKNAEARIVHAEACNAELEGLQALVEFEQCSVEDAVKLYQQYVTKIPFVEETGPPPVRRTPGGRRRGASRPRERSR